MVTERRQGCVVYDIRGYETQWRFCLRRGVIESATGNQPPADGGRRLLAGPPFVGLGCDEANSIACDRLGVQVRLRRPAHRVVVRIGDGTAALPADSGEREGRVFTGRVAHAGIVDGRLRIHPDRGRYYWAGGHARDATVTVTAVDTRGVPRSASARVAIRPGFG